jgi:hypothetical protein
MIYMIAGSKGGIGKSLVSISVCDILGVENVALVETDTSNPDVYKAIGTKVSSVTTLNLDIKDDWIKLVDFIDENVEKDVVINTRSAANIGINKFGDLLTEASQMLEKKITVLWVMNSDADGVILLRDFLDNFEHSELVETHVVLNEHFGDPDTFKFSGSETENRIIDMRGNIVRFPDLANRVRTMVYNERKSLSEVCDSGSLGVRIEAKRWREKVKENFSEIVS